MRGDLLRARAGLVESSDRIVLYQGGFAPNRGLEQLVAASPHFHGAVLVLMGWGGSKTSFASRLPIRGSRAKSSSFHRHPRVSSWNTRQVRTSASFHISRLV